MMSNNTFSNTFQPTAASTSLFGFVEDVQARRFVIAGLDELGNFSMASKPAIHASETLANAEKSRLARANPGKAFVVMQLRSGAMVPRVVGQYDF